MGLPREADVSSRPEPRGFHMKVVSRQELRGCRRRTLQGLLGTGGGDDDQEERDGGSEATDYRSEGVRHSASFCSSSAMRASSSTTRFLNAGSWRYTADDLSHSRWPMAG